ncbi:MAG: O-methyltransferase [Alphaproteobacteria bacterium]|nr:O-methyltransferase [Alphaproteobacteria bacterium]
MTFTDRRDYIRQTYATETAAQKKARESLTDPNDQISIHPEDGRFLQCLIHLAKVKTIVEIGTLGGYSALWMADALPDDGLLTTIEYDPRRAAIARDNTKHEKKIKIIEGDALTVLPQLSQDGPFDMAFIDADKLQYGHYLDWAEENIRKDGLIICDNAFLFDAVWKDGPVDRVRETARRIMRDVNTRLADPEKYHAILLPTVEGMAVAQKRF